jgi:hypothetical protein
VRVRRQHGSVAEDPVEELAKRSRPEAILELLRCRQKVPLRYHCSDILWIPPEAYLPRDSPVEKLQQQLRPTRQWRPIGPCHLSGHTGADEQNTAHCSNRINEFCGYDALKFLLRIVHYWSRESLPKRRIHLHARVIVSYLVTNMVLSLPTQNSIDPIPSDPPT